MPTHLPGVRDGGRARGGRGRARCPNPFCPAQRLGGLLHFTGRGGMDVEGLGYKVMVQLVERDLVNEPADIFGLNVETLEGLDRFARKSAENLTAAIERSRQRPLYRILDGLGIRHAGVQTAIDLAAGCRRTCRRSAGSRTRHGPARGRAAARRSAEELTAVFGVGAVVAEGIARFFRDEHTGDVLHRWSRRRQGRGARAGRSAEPPRAR